MSDTYSPSLLDTAREHLDALVTAYMMATGAPHYAVGKLIRNDHKWVAAYPNLNFRVGSYDEAVQTFSAIWPEGLAWPSEVPRQAPALLTDEQRAMITHQFEKGARHG